MPVATTSTWRCTSPHHIPLILHHQLGISLGAAQFAASDAWAERGLLALVGMGVEPGFSDVAARYAADHLFSTIHEIGVRDGNDLVIEGFAFAPTFSIWTTIEECLNPPIIYERDRGWFTTEPFSEPELFMFPEGIGELKCVNVEHEEVLLMPRWIDVDRVTFKYGLGDEFLEVLVDTAQARARLARLPSRCDGVEMSPRDLVAACPPESRRARATHARPHLRRHDGDRHRRRRRATVHLPVPDRRQRMDDARVRAPGRGVADGRASGDRLGTAGDGRVERRRGERARKRSPPTRSCRCSPNTARRGRWRNGRHPPIEEVRRRATAHRLRHRSGGRPCRVRCRSSSTCQVPTG